MCCMKRLLVIQPWKRTWHDLTMCSECQKTVVFITKVNDWYLVFRYEPSAKDGMELIETFDSIGDAILFAQALTIND